MTFYPNRFEKMTPFVPSKWHGPIGTVRNQRGSLLNDASFLSERSPRCAGARPGSCDTGVIGKRNDRGGPILDEDDDPALGL